MKAVFVQNNFIERLSGPLAVVAREHGYDLFDISILPDEPFDADDLDIEWEGYDRVFVYGSVGFVRRCMNSSLRKYVYFDQERLAASRWVRELNGYALNSRGRVVDFGNVGTLLEKGQMHLRPDNHEKAFTGAVFSLKGWEEIVEARSLTDIQGLKIWVSPVQQIKAEYRCFIVGGEPVEISLYRKDGAPDRTRITDEAVFEAARGLAAVHLPLSTVVMDIAMTSDGYKAIEFNPIHGSGWYAVDIARVLDRVMSAPSFGMGLEADDVAADNDSLAAGP